MGKSLCDMTVKGYCWILPLKFIFRSSHVRCGRQSFNLQADVSGDHTNFENAMCKMFCPKICAAFSTDTIQDSNLLLGAIKKNAAWMIGSSNIMEAKRMASLITGFNCSLDAVSWLFKCMLGLWCCCCWLLWRRWLIKGCDCKLLLSARQ